MIKTPQELKYTATHEWVRMEPDGTATIGITDFAQEALGDVVFVEFPKVGAKVKARDAVAVVAPLSGEVVAVNGSIPDHWDAINKDAFAALLFKLKPSDPGELKKLLDAAGYAASAKESK
jgi:glycine cleavage system H protein